MYTIWVCEDETAIREKICQMIEDWSHGRDQAVCVQSYASADQMLAQCNDTASTDILITDILMLGMNGFDAARMLHVKMPVLSIIFMTGTIEYATKGYELDAVRYLIKPVQQEQLFEALDASVMRNSHQQDPILLIKGKQPLAFSYQDIVMVESIEHSVVIHLLSGEPVRIRVSLKSIEDQLDAHYFVQCHRAYYVNMTYVRSFDRKNIYLVNNLIACLSRNYVTNTKQAFREFCHKEMRIR